MHLALLTEYSFKQCFLHMRDIHKYVRHDCVGIADCNNTYGHIPLLRESREHNFTPIFGVRLHCLPDESKQRVCNIYWIFIAKNNKGLEEIYDLVRKAYDNFYYIPKLLYSDLNLVSDDVITIAPFSTMQSHDYVAIGQGYGPHTYGDGIAIDFNRYPEPRDKSVYQLMAGSRKNGDGYVHMFSDTTHPQHILSHDEYLADYGTLPLKRAYDVASECNATIPQAEMVKWTGTHDIEKICRMKINKIPEWTQIHEERLMYEINLIIEKGYVDYFMITADLIKHCKKTMLVGPARGSSAGSLVCYLLDITEVDPIEHNLIFERFIDINRFDLPDIDIDFPDSKRENAIKYLKHKYGKANVMCLANVNSFKPKSAIGEFAKGLGIPAYETDGVKGAIIERSSADARAAMCITDTFETTAPGKDFITQYPQMALVKDIEGHSSHAGKHAAGIIVSTLPLRCYGSVNNRDEVVMIDRWGAEYIDLLKIDCLGLRTLSILEGVAEQIGMEYADFNTLLLDDVKTYELFNSQRLNGIFQFEGQALQMIVKQMGVNNFGDIAAITALARPGALNSGGTSRYIKYSTGVEEPKYYSEVHKEITGETFGIVVYQEQMMELARRCGGMSWEDVSTLRKASSKSYGDEFFGKYKDIFITGALENGYPPDVCQQLWQDISASGSWSFNKSHAVSYGLISYWTAWCKANYPMEFAVASLNHAASPENAIKLLRDLIKNEGFEYVPVDPDLSELGWSYSGNTLIGGLTNIKGIADAKGKQILKARAGGKKITPSLFKLLSEPITDFDILFPTDHYWGHLYRDPRSYDIEIKPRVIESIEGKGEYVFIGCLVDRNLRDLNEQVFLEKRGGERIEEQTQYLNFKLEDDTDMISCKISRYNYENLGVAIAESGRIGKDWYLAYGKITGDWRRVDIIEIVNLNQLYPEIGKLI